MLVLRFFCGECFAKVFHEKVAAYLEPYELRRGECQVIVLWWGRFQIVLVYSGTASS